MSFPLFPVPLDRNNQSLRHVGLDFQRACARYLDWTAKRLECWPTRDQVTHRKDSSE